MNDMIGQGIIHPLAVVNGGVGRLRRWQKCEIGYDTAILFHHEAPVSLYIRTHGLKRGIAIDPLLRVSVSHHNGFCRRENLKDSLSIIWQFGGADSVVL